MNLKTFTPVICLIVLSSCFSSKEYVVEHDYNYRGKFAKYRTYEFIKLPIEQVGLTEEQAAIIEASIQDRLSAQGYTKVNRKPDLLISYSVFSEDFKFPGYNQPNFEYWLKNEQNYPITFKENLKIEKEIELEKQLTDEELLEQELKELKDEYKDKDYQLVEGTLLIQMLDRRRQQTVWQGYASGLFSKEGNFNNQRYLPRYVRNILNKYRIIARGYLLKSQLDEK